MKRTHSLGHILTVFLRGVGIGSLVGLLFCAINKRETTPFFSQGSYLRLFIVYMVCGLLALVGEYSSMIFQGKHLLRETLLHLLLNGTFLLLAAFSFRWILPNAFSILSFILVYLLIYAVIWIFIYFKTKRDVDTINEHLRK